MKCAECKHYVENEDYCEKRTAQNHDECVENNFKCDDFESAVMDNVNNPRHYNSHPSGVECKEIIRHMNFNLGSAIKYIWRTGLKSADTGIEDLQKAVSCIQDEIKRLEDWGNDTTSD